MDRDARAAFDIARSVEQGGETHLLYEVSKNQHLQLILPAGHPPAVPLVAMVPIGLEGFDRVEAIYRLLATLHGRAVPPDTRLTRQKRRRMRHMLQAFDGFRDGATQPELPDHVAIVKERTEMRPAEEFTRILDDDPEDVARQRQALRRQMTGIARQVSLDPGDGIGL
ncbi:MAG: DUF2285 domain-containing protein [Xanthobacteraceae bacterium]|nr:DUF2285 domain-containing protein [Xanthobacteraceae bacterium]